MEKILVTKSPQVLFKQGKARNIQVTIDWTGCPVAKLAEYATRHCIIPWRDKVNTAELADQLNGATINWTEFTSGKPLDVDRMVDSMTDDQLDQAVIKMLKKRGLDDAAIQNILEAEND